MTSGREIAALARAYVRQLLTHGKSQYRRAPENGKRSKRTILTIYRCSFDVDFLREYLSSAWRLFERWADRLFGDRVSCRTFWGELPRSEWRVSELRAH